MLYEEILKIVISKIYSKHLYSTRIEDYQIENLAKEAHRVSSVLFKKIKDLERV